MKSRISDCLAALSLLCSVATVARAQGPAFLGGVFSNITDVGQ